MRRIIDCTVILIAKVSLLMVLLGAGCFVPINCDPRRDQDLDKPLFQDPRNREIDPATAKAIIPAPGRHLVRPSEVGKN
jgi:hypothetical protein